MKLNDLIASHVANTALDPAAIKIFLQTAPHYHQWGVDCQIDQHSLDQLDATDLFEFYFRYYLVGRHKTLQAISREVRAFVSEDANAAHHCIIYSMELTRQSLLSLEWYELLPRLEAAKVTILQLVPDEKAHIRPRLIRFLERSY